MLFAFKAWDAKCIFQTRGNHETKNMNKIYGFEGEVKAKYPPTPNHYLGHSQPLPSEANTTLIAANTYLPQARQHYLHYLYYGHQIASSQCKVANSLAHSRRYIAITLHALQRKRSCNV